MRGLLGAAAVLIGLAFAVAALPAAGPAAAPGAVDDAALMADAPAPTLSAYHLFTDDGAQRPNARVTPYDIATPLFSDYAAKTRLFYLPRGARAQVQGMGLLGFPVGSVLIKTFAFPADLRRPGEAVRKIETRLLIHRPSGWTALTYVWNEAGTQAVLKRAGLRVPVLFVDAEGRTRETLYGVPNVNQCKECHSQSGEMVPIGVKARNLNVLTGHGDETQLDAWRAAGLTAGVMRGRPPLSVRWDDPAAPVTARARAYLDANCGHCHSRAGLASNSGLYLTMEETDPAVLGVGKRPVAAGRASGDLMFDIAPGDPDGSIIVHRMASTDPGVMMPQLGRTLPHDEGIALVRAYIRGLR